MSLEKSHSSLIPADAVYLFIDEEESKNNEYGSIFLSWFAEVPDKDRRSREYRIGEELVSVILFQEMTKDPWKIKTIKESVWIHFIYTKERHRGTGIASKLLDGLATDYEIHLFTEPEEIPFYEKNKFYKNILPLKGSKGWIMSRKKEALTKNQRKKRAKKIDKFLVTKLIQKV